MNELAHMERIRQLAPDVELANAELNDEGLANDVVLTESWVFRFPKTEWARRALAGELAVLDCLRGRLALQIPAPARVEDDVIVYPRVPGEALDRLTLTGMSAVEQQRLAADLGTFLAQLHGSELAPGLPTTGAPVTYEAQLARRNDAERYVYPHLMKHQRRYADSVYRILEEPRALEFRPRLIHGDLGPYHLLVRNSRLTGVIDFGTAGVGDPANDVACLLQHYGETFLSGCALTYTELPSLLRRARYLAQALEFEWLVHGLKTEQAFWFTAHIGTARDLRG